MTIWLIFGGLALIGELFTIWWHRLREAEKPASTALVSGILELLSWAPIWVAIQENDPGIMLASIAGAAVGTYLGMRFKGQVFRHRKSSEAPKGTESR